MLFASIALLVLAAAVPSAQSGEPVDIIKVAQTATEQLEKGDYAAVMATFNPRLKERFPEAKLRQTWQDLHRRAGVLKTTSTPLTRTVDNLRRVIIPAQFEKRKMEIEWVFNADGQVSGLLLHRK
jgi:hypothetical protein